jgi:hypothetical protein
MNSMKWCRVWIVDHRVVRSAGEDVCSLGWLGATSHTSPRSNSLLHARHLGIQRRKPSLLNRIFHGRTLQNQMRSLLIHHSTSAATAPVNLETWQRSGAQVEPKNSVLTLLVELLVIFGIFQSFDWAHRIVFPTSPLVLIIFEQSKVCLRFVLSPHRCLGIINYTSLEPGGETTVSLRFVVCTIMIFTVRISNLPKGLWIQPWFFC